MMKKGFTLLELLTVVSIMAFLGVASTAGYSALTRGIKERGAVSAASAFLRAAKERALIDRVPTAVFCYNRMLKDTYGAVDSSQVVVGEMIAVRQYGRISYVQGDVFFDEFADLGAIFGEEETKSGMRLYRFSGRNMSDMQYSVVSVVSDLRRLQLFSRTMADDMIEMYGFKKLQQSDREPSGWSVGSAYAMEFGELTLPQGFVFEGGMPMSFGQISQPRVLVFDPQQVGEVKQIEIRATKTDASGKAVISRRVGEATSNEKEGV